MVRATLVLLSAVVTCGCGLLYAWAYSGPPGPPPGPRRSRYWTTLYVDVKSPADQQQAEQLFSAAATRLGFRCRREAKALPASLLHCVPKTQDDGQFHLSTTALEFKASTSCASIEIEAYSKEGGRPPSSYRTARWAILDHVATSSEHGVRVYGGEGWWNPSCDVEHYP
jgi:hypothetical protein